MFWVFILEAFLLRTGVAPVSSLYLLLMVLLSVVLGLYSVSYNLILTLAQASQIIYITADPQPPHLHLREEAGNLMVKKRCLRMF